MQGIRPLYLGWAPFAEALGLPAKERKDKAVFFYLGRKIDEKIDYIFYGPSEKRHFPDFPVLNYPIAYRDKQVIIYRTP